VLVLVPEIGLTPQLRERFARRIDAPMAVLHSASARRERELAWRARPPRPARGCCSARARRLHAAAGPGLIIVDEEHDLSLKQQDGFRYSARDLAVRRAQLADCPVCSARRRRRWRRCTTPAGRYRHLILPQRAGARWTRRSWWPTSAPSRWRPASATRC
jgi:primosomal protein N' (replication factor Y)